MLRNDGFLFFLIALIGFFTGSCSNSGNAPGSSVTLPQVTAPVGSASTAASVRAQATKGQSLNTQTCSGCAGSSHLSEVWAMASIFVLQGKLADLNSCIIQALVKSNAVSGLTSGSYVYMTTSSSNLKVAITLDGSNLKSFELFGCSGTTQDQYLSGTKTGNNVTFSGRLAGGSAFVTMDATGTMSGNTWTTKSLTVGEYNSAAPNYSQFVMTQQSGYLDISGVFDQGTLGTLDSTDIRFVSRAQLVGNSVATYALGDGSVLMATGSGASAQWNWNGDTAVEGSGPTTYDSVVAGETLPSIPTTRATAFASSEQWNCSVSANAVNVEMLAASNSGLTSDLATCIGGFQ